MHMIPEDVFRALQRWQSAYTGYEKAQSEPKAAAELVLASQCLSASFQDYIIPHDQRHAVSTWDAEGGS